MDMSLREDTPDKAGALAGSVGHVRAWDGTGSTSALAVEEDQEDERAYQGDTSNHPDDNASNGASAQLGAGVVGSAASRSIGARSGAST